MNKGSRKNKNIQLSLVLWSLMCVYIVSPEFHIDPEDNLWLSTGRACQEKIEEEKKERK